MKKLCTVCKQEREQGVHMVQQGGWICDCCYRKFVRPRLICEICGRYKIIAFRDYKLRMVCFDCLGKT